MKIKLLAIVAVVLATVSSGWASGFVKSNGPGLVLDGKPYRAIGVNMPTLFSDYIAANLTMKKLYGTPEKSRQYVIDGVNDARKSSVAFIRFWASGYWPADMNLYFEDPQAYWKSMDEVFAMCQKNNIKLVPSIFFNIHLWPMLYDEDRQAILDPNSKTYAAMHKYAKELVSRYKDDTNVLMWEVTNELFTGADIQMEGREAPDKVAYRANAKVIKTLFNKNDTLSTEMMVDFYKEMTAYIKSIDANHLVTSGDLGVRESSQGLRKAIPGKEWVLDTLRDSLSSLLYSQPEPLDVISIHCYGPNLEQRIAGGLSSLNYGVSAVKAAHAASTPIFIGELGNIAPSFKEDKKAKWTVDAINTFEKSGVDLIAIWAWYFPSQPDNTTSGSSNPDLMKRIARFNKDHKSIR